ALQAALAGGDRAGARGVVRIDLADDEQAFAPAADCLGDRLLGAALAVHLRRVDQRDAEVEPELDGGNLGGPLRTAPAHAPGAEAQNRPLLARFQHDGSHAFPPVPAQDALSRRVIFRRVLARYSLAGPYPCAL